MHTTRRWGTIRFLMALAGIALVLVAGLSVIQARRELSQIRELVRELESRPRTPDRRDAALEHARRSVPYLEDRYAHRWSVGGYMFAGTAWALLGAGLLAFSFRGRTPTGG